MPSSRIFQSTIAALKAIDRGFSAHGGETIQWEVVEAGFEQPDLRHHSWQGSSVRDGRHGREGCCEAFVSGDCTIGSRQYLPGRFR